MRIELLHSVYDFYAAAKNKASHDNFALAFSTLCSRTPLFEKLTRYKSVPTISAHVPLEKRQRQLAHRLLYWVDLCLLQCRGSMPERHWRPWRISSILR